jgi:hypothetical protein
VLKYKLKYIVVLDITKERVVWQTQCDTCGIIQCDELTGIAVLVAGSCLARALLYTRSLRWNVHLSQIKLKNKAE